MPDCDRCSYTLDSIDTVIIELEREIENALSSPTDQETWTRLTERLVAMKRSFYVPISETTIAQIAMRGGEATQLWKTLHRLTQTERTDVNRCAVVKSTELWSELVQFVETAYEVYSEVVNSPDGRKSPLLCGVSGRITPALSSPSPTKRVK
jgi:hypothetical protein